MAGTDGAFRVSCLRARLFGVLRLERDGGQVHLPAKVGSLLAYLILHPGPQPREKMAALLWGDVPDEQARHSLRTALNHIRKELDDGLVAGDRDSIRLNPSFPLWVDVREFVQRIGFITEAPPGNLALFDLYRGELLADLDDEWVFPERERYARQYEEALLRTAQHARSGGRYDWAIVLARQVLARDPANERAHQHVMFCLAASGDRAAALRQYEACRRALRDELDAPPASETDALRDWIRQTDCKVPSAESLVTNLPVALTRLVGRGEERLRIKGLLARGECAHDASSGSRLLTLTGRRQRTGDLCAVLQDVLDPEWTALQTIVERLALHQFHDEIVRTDVMERADVRVVQLPDRTRFTLEARTELLVSPLDGHVASKTGVSSPIDLTHAPGADLREDLVRPEARSCRDWHALRAPIIGGMGRGNGG